MADPWSPARRSQIKRKIDKEATRTAGRLGAASVVVIAFFRDGEYLHMQDGGASPMPAAELYRAMLTAVETVATSGGKDVNIQ